MPNPRRYRQSLVFEVISSHPEPITFTAIVREVAQMSNLRQCDVKEQVRETLDTCVSHGFLNKANRRFFLPEVNFPVKHVVVLPPTVTQQMPRMHAGGNRYANVHGGPIPARHIPGPNLQGHIIPARAMQGRPNPSGTIHGHIIPARATHGRFVPGGTAQVRPIHIRSASIRRSYLAAMYGKPIRQPIRTQPNRGKPIRRKAKPAGLRDDVALEGESSGCSSAGANSAGTNSVGTNFACTNSGGTNSAGANFACTNSGGTNFAGSCSAGSCSAGSSSGGSASVFASFTGSEASGDGAVAQSSNEPSNEGFAVRVGSNDYEQRGSNATSRVSAYAESEEEAEMEPEIPRRARRRAPMTGGRMCSHSRSPQRSNRRRN